MPANMWHSIQVHGIWPGAQKLEYMSPEQAKFNQLDIDTHSDIYSQGVLLYACQTRPMFLHGDRH
jgi:hypothetical protein